MLYSCSFVAKFMIMATNCVFCNICAGKDSTEILYEDDKIAIFQDIKPASKYHYLAVPKEHIKDGKALTTDHKELGLFTCNYCFHVCNYIFIDGPSCL